MDDIFFLNLTLKKKKTYKTHIKEKKKSEKQTCSWWLTNRMLPSDRLWCSKSEPEDRQAGSDGW